MKRRTPSSAVGPSATQSRVIKKLAPDQNGAGRHRKQHGDSLVCVRYREDAVRRYTTIELVVDTRPLPYRQIETVAVRIDLFDRALRKQIIECGGVWDANEKVWRMQKNIALALHLAKKIVK